jgi:hypothetical protein
MIAIRSPSRSASSRSWVMNTIVLAELRAGADHLVCCICILISGSSALNGSSISSTFGAGGDRARQADALLHPARERAGRLGAPAAQAHHLDHLVGAAHPLGARDPLDLEAVGDVVAHAAVRQQAEALEHHGQVVACGCRAAARVRGADVDLALVGLSQTWPEVVRSAG